jgi:hypothetical protein
VIWKMGAVVFCLDIIGIVYCLAIGETTQAIKVSAAAVMLGITLAISKGVV